ncbi:MAG: hypothetical protein J1E99_07980 [Muribaculaceae bacterium]|nr:hypothetical protein [Muribaculaceae bacterium]
MKGKILTMAFAGSLLYLCSCSDASKYDALVQPQPGEEQEQLSDEVEVTFTIAPESAGTISRAVGDQQTISKGKNIDILIFAVYDDEYTLLQQYGSNDTITNWNTDAGKDAGVQRTSFNKISTENSAHKGQGVRYVGDKFPEGQETITLRLMRGQTYHLAFWAQSSQTEAFNTGNLEAVTVDYSAAKNNDELRDAFCKVETFSVSSGTASSEITLTRPFAQINVGTTSENFSDFRAFLSDDDGNLIAYSKLELTGVATKMDVVRDIIDNKSTTNVTFGYEEIPATKFATDDQNEYLIINTPVTGSSSDKNYQTTAYTYLSMCYVLVPGAQVQTPNYDSEATGTDVDNSETHEGGFNGNDETYGTTLDKVTFYISNSTTSDLNSEYGFKPVVVIQLPVHRNWRTNIIGDDILPTINGRQSLNMKVQLESGFYGDKDPQIYEKEQNSQE